ncbi:MAG: HEPN domain-containing protein [Floccifex sp.]
MEPFYVNYNSETRVFLNVVQALETYHSRFITNRIDDFKLRVDEITKKLPSPRADELKNYLMAKSKGFITLESRLADLLFASGNIYFDTGEIKHEDFPSIIAHTRNYYIHYDESIKDKYILLPEDKLHIYNRSLLQILEYYILLELGFSDNIEIKKKLVERWGKASQSLDILRISKEKHKAS